VPTIALKTTNVGSAATKPERIMAELTVAGSYKYMVALGRLSHAGVARAYYAV